VAHLGLATRAPGEQMGLMGPMGLMCDVFPMSDHSRHAPLRSRASWLLDSGSSLAGLALKIRPPSLR
jgi:hypothetical protein